MPVNIPRIRHDEPWQSPNVDTWRESLRAQVLENDRRITVTWLGLYDQVQDKKPDGQPLDAASNYTPGEYYVLEVNGVFSTAIPELNGVTGGVGDQIISNGTTWQILARSTAYLSSQVADTAAGVITFTPAPVSSAAATAATELIRKGESDAGDAVVQGNLDTHVGHTLAANDVHGGKTYADNQDAAHAALQANPDDVHGTKAYTDQTMADHVATDATGGPAVHPQYMLTRNVVTYFPWKAAAVQFNGSLAITHSFNVTGVTDQGTGVYRIALNQTTINGNAIADFLVPVVSVFTPDSAGEAVFIRFNPGAPAGSIDVYCFTLVVAGQSLFDVDYTLGANDIVWVMALLNVADPNADPLPP